MEIETDSECNVKWTLPLCLGVVCLGVLLLTLSRYDLLESQAECWWSGIACVIAGVIGVPWFFLQRRHRCRSILSEEGIEFLPADRFGQFNFQWSSITGWSWLTELYGNGDSGWTERFLCLEFRDGHRLRLPERHFHPAITAELELRVGSPACRVVEV